MRTTPVILALSIVTLLALSACGSDDTTQDIGNMDRAACQAFRATAQDQADGTLTAEELRQGLQEVERIASAGADETVHTAARDLVAALTTHGYDATETADAVTSLGQACTDAGY